MFAERAAAGYFVDFVLDREKLARYGLSVEDANTMVMTAVGGDNQTTTIEGRQRYGVNVRYARDFREDVDALKRKLRTTGDLVDAIIHGAVKCVRPKAMTVSAALIGLLPVMRSTGTGADLMKRIAAPMVGGLITSFAMELLVYPAIYYLWRRKGLAAGPATT